MRRLLFALTAGFALMGATETASAQEILLTGPLAGAPPVRKLRLYREGRLEVAPAVSFTLLDQYQRTIFLGGRLTYNITDWLGIGVWGAYGGLLQLSTNLTDEIQGVNADRRAQRAARGGEPSVDDRLTAVNLGPDFEEQIGSINWLAAPQLTIVPFRGKIALFDAIYFDSELYISGGAAFVNVRERAECTENCSITPFAMEERTAIAPTGALGLTFFVNKWNALGVELRVMPFERNLGGFDVAGSGPDEEFPDNRVTDADRELSLNPMVTVSWNFYLPTEYRISE